MYFTPPTRKPFVWKELLSDAAKPATCSMSARSSHGAAYDSASLIVGDLARSAPEERSQSHIQVARLGPDRAAAREAQDRRLRDLARPDQVRVHV